MLAIREHRLAGKQIIEEQARRQVRTFLDEVKNGTQNYRTVASLGGQVAQEYRGRAILELLQNAHDVLAFADEEDPRRISFMLRSSPKPELLVANSGRPFLHEDFKGICQLAQSPKDPNESVGNKGLGFQSVLELSTRPEVWSTAPAGDDTAFTFGFDPDVREPIGRVAQRLVNGHPPTDQEFGPEHVVDWSPEQIGEYRRRLSQEDIDPVKEVNKYLSPYVVPRFLNEPPPEVAGLLEDGHVTVIRLPLDGGKTGSANNAVESVREQLKALHEAAMVFLGHLSVLRISIDDDHTELKREADPELPFPAAATRRERLRVSRSKPDASDGTERSFHVWSRIVGGEDQPEETERIADAVRHLPNRWPEVRRVEVAVAVEETEEARKGVFVIFLPTKMKTGAGAHINAPFYGSLDRRQINFGDKYNDLLLEFVTDLMLDATGELVESDSEPWRGRAAIDLIARATDSHAFDEAQPLADRLCQRAHDQGRPLDQLALIHCDDGWRLPAVARTMPAVPDDDPIGGAVWRSHAGFTLVSCALDERRNAVEALLRSLGGSPIPRHREWAFALEQIAGKIAERKVDVTWDDFLSSVLAVLPQAFRSEPRESDPDPLREARFLPTDDDRLLSASDDTQIFFRPRRGADDAADFVGSIPESLKERIAFLHPGVKTHEGPQRRNTEVQKFLDGRFVQRFRREDLLRDVVIPSLPELPATHGSPEAAACAETLRWTLKMIGQEEQERPLRLLSRLPVACVGGWFAMPETVFGPGWDGRCGDHLEMLANALSDEDADKLLRTALLPPGDTRWGFGADAGHPESETLDVANWGDLFARVGVAKGFRIEPLDPVRFWMSGAHVKLPGEAPADIAQSSWDDWRDAVRRQEIGLGYTSSFEYELNDVRLLPVRDLLHRRDLAGPARQALAELILAALAHWKGGWGEVTIKKKQGWSWSRRITSPLEHWLSTLPWLDDGHDGGQRPLRQRWLVPASLLRGQAGRFRHLSPLPPQLAYRLAEDETLRSTLENLGLHVYPTEDALTGPDLLNALADVATKAPGEMPAGGFDVFLGQLRQAWRYFDPNRQLPEHFLVRTSPRTLKVRSGTELGDVYLPDHSANTRSLREHRQPILAMRPVEANGDIGARLHDELGVSRASNLEERCLIDGLRDVDPTEGALGLDATGLGWLPVVLLTLAAHGGANPRGPATDAWQEAAARLRRVRVRRCHSIAVELVDEGRTVASSKPQAHWLSQDRILLLNRGVAESRLHEEMAAAVQAILDRQDLLKDLRLVMGSLAGVLQPTGAEIDAALERAEIDAETVADIRLRWGGTTMLLDRIRPVVKLLGVSDAGLDAATIDTSRLEARLATWVAGKRPDWSTEKLSKAAQDLIVAARECYDDREMGFRAWQVLGDAAELRKWNEALRALGGEYSPVTNDRAKYQATRHLEEAARWLRAFARHVANGAHNHPTLAQRAELFSKINAVHESIQSDAKWPHLCEKWSTRWWKVPFRAVLDVLSERYARIPEAKPHIDAVRGAKNIEGLISALKRKEVTLEPDPLEMARRNWHRVSRVVRSVWQVYDAWLRREEPGSPIPRAPELPLDPSMYLREWSDANLLDRAKHEIGNEYFVQACADCETIESMRAELDLPEPTPDPTGDSQDGGQEGEGANVLIAGITLRGRSPRDIQHLFGQLEDLAEPTGPQVHRDEVTALTDSPPTRPRNSGGLRPAGEAGVTGGKNAHMYASPHLPELIGIVGEMQAFRFLRARFGINEHAWVSEFRTKVLPLREGEKDETSDSHGYDFRFAYCGKTWCVEVKATTGDGTSFDLSSGEMAAANRIAAREDERWRILRVRKALSGQPECDWLPNPFVPGAGQRLRLRQGSMTVEYTPSKRVEEHRG